MSKTAMPLCAFQVTSFQKAARRGLLRDPGSSSLGQMDAALLAVLHGLKQILWKRAG